MQKPIELDASSLEKLKYNRIAEFWQFFDRPELAEQIKNEALSVYMGSRLTIGEAIKTAIVDYNNRLYRTRQGD